MLITHKLKKSVSENVDSKNLSFILVSNKGNYFSLPIDASKQITKYNGWFNVVEKPDKSYTVYKSIESIYLTDADNNKITANEFVNDFSYVSRISNKSSENFILMDKGVAYDVSCENSWINIDLDFREIFDNSDIGRIYSVYRDIYDCLVIEYTKYFDVSLKKIDKKFYLAIKGIEDDYEFINKWERKHYEYDSSRNDGAEFYVFKALRIACKKNKKLIFAFSDKKDRAISKIVDIMQNSSELLENHRNAIKLFEDKYSIHKISDHDVAMAYVNCLNFIKNIDMDIFIDNKKIKGLWAGLPWFFQFWARDELISLGAMIQENQFATSKEILFRHLNEIDHDGRIPNLFPHVKLASADATGWLFKRLDDLMKKCISHKVFDVHFSLFDVKYIHDRLRFSIKQIMKTHSRDGLIHNNNLETWMDTFYKDGNYETDFREGFRIEIQALFLNMLRFMAKLDDMLANKFVKKVEKLHGIKSGDVDYSMIEKEMVIKVRKSFLFNMNGKNVLNDGYDCSYPDVVRPNIFLAFYVYRELLSDGEWQDVFDYSLSRLWCEWNVGEKFVNVKTSETTLSENFGGLSSIDKYNSIYKPVHTGLDNKSYHRGDSWFFMNNIAAICMNDLNLERYRKYVGSIINADCRDVLYNGFIGCASELSSSANFSSCGCLAQTWSVATFIELVNKVYKE